MKNISKKKLGLAKDTLRALTPAQAASVHGGTSAYAPPTPACQLCRESSTSSL